MRDIARLLFGDDANGLADLFGGSGDPGAAERTRRSREWCGGTPGSGSVEEAVRRAAGGRRTAHGLRRQAVTRQFRTR